MGQSLVRLTTGCRVHLGLLDLNGEIGRVDGGIGMALDNPGLKATAVRSEELHVTGPLSKKVRAGARAILDETNGVAADITVKKGIPQHVGLGSGTQATLTGAAAVAHLNNLEFTNKELADITGRGGTSGIGMAAFSSGGFILDAGHNLKQKGGFLPSSVSKTSPPPVISRMQFPDWEIKLFIPEGKGAYGSDELSVFSDECPIPAAETAKVCRIVVMKLMPAVKEARFSDFREALAKIQRIGFKSREIERQPVSKEIVQELHERGCAVGMSSFGPTVFAVHPNKVGETSAECEIINTSPDTTGATISNSQ